MGQHRFYSFWIDIPILTIFGIVIPFCIAYQISKSGKTSDFKELKNFLKRFKKFILPDNNNRTC